MSLTSKTFTTLTIAIWTKPASGEEMTEVNRVLKCFRDVWLCMVKPETSNVGFATWSLRKETLQPIHHYWHTPPSPWVLHRGNMAGLSKSTENDPRILLET